jgi:hypothetical protein
MLDHRVTGTKGSCDWATCLPNTPHHLRTSARPDIEMEVEPCAYRGVRGYRLNAPAQTVARAASGAGLGDNGSEDRPFAAGGPPRRLVSVAVTLASSTGASVRCGSGMAVTASVILLAPRRFRQRAVPCATRVERSQTSGRGREYARMSAHR